MKVGDVADLSRTICEIIDDPVMAEQIGALAKSRAESFKPEVIYEEWNHYLSKIIEMC